MMRKLIFLLLVSFLTACTAEGAARWPLTILLGGQSAAPTLPYQAAPLANLPLTDVRSGETFILAEFAGKTVFVEPMATW